jgi:predicted transcriptional regulator
MPITLDERDRATLERLRRGEATIESLTDSVDCSVEYLESRLPELADNGLVERGAGEEYALTANGERVLAATPAGTRDDRIDTPPEVEAAIASFDLRPDREEAVRNAFAFLHYWGEASESEVVDAVYSENPAGFESSDGWWTEIRGYLEDLPSVEPPRAADGEWQYTGTPTVDESSDDGRLLFENEAVSRSSVKFALERLDLTDDERAAVRDAFRLLADAGEVSASELEDEVYADHDAGYESADEWWTDCVRPAFERLPGVEQSDADRDVWRYQDSTRDAEQDSTSSDE